MKQNFEQWKKELVDDFCVTIRGHENEELYEKISGRFLNKIHSLNYYATEDEADVLFSLFTDEEDYEVLETVISQLEDTKDKELFVKCLLKAFPRLVNEAKYWATTFLYIIQKEELLKLVKESEDNNGKQSIIDYINKSIAESTPSPRELSNENAMKHYLKELEDFKALATQIEESMK
jgi:hypothetical protein